MCVIKFLVLLSDRLNSLLKSFEFLFELFKVIVESFH